MGRWSRGAAAISILAFIAVAPLAVAQVSGSIESVPYYINISSFDSFYPPGVDVTRIIEDAARQWTWAGGSRKVLDNLGTTTDTGCTNNNNIYAVAGCSPNGCNVDCGLTTACSQGTFSVMIRPQACGGVAYNETAGQIDLQWLVQHEFGHALGLSHEYPQQTYCNSAAPWCVMNPFGCPNDRSRRFFCVDEIEQASSVDGTAWDDTWVHARSDKERAGV